MINSKTDNKITYGVEVNGYSTGNINEQLLTANSDFVEILDENCNVMPEVCDGKKYIELKNQLESLESEEEYLNEQFALYKDEQIASYLKKIASES